MKYYDYKCLDDKAEVSKYSNIFEDYLYIQIFQKIKKPKYIDIQLLKKMTILGYLNIQIFQKMTKLTAKQRKQGKKKTSHW